MREILIGIAASMFFAVTFILNRSMELGGGSWLWSSSLRFLFMVPFLVIIVLLRKNMKQLLQEMVKNPLPWIVWSFTGFVLFYGPLTYAAAYGPGWLVAGTWQLTIVAGVLLTPFFYKSIPAPTGTIKVREKIPVFALIFSVIIFSGVMLMQWQHGSNLTWSIALLSILPVAVAAFAYPLGNRKMMELCGGRLDTFQRVLGMTLASLPFWVIIGSAGYATAGLPSSSQMIQAFVVAVCSGVVATTLFFIATDRTKGDQGKLAAVEATQSTQVMFVLVGEVLLLSAPLPDGLAFGGMFLVVLGMLLHSFFARKSVEKLPDVNVIKSEQKI